MNRRRSLVLLSALLLLGCSGGGSRVFDPASANGMSSSAYYQAMGNSGNTAYGYPQGTANGPLSSTVSMQDGYGAGGQRTSRDYGDPTRFRSDTFQRSSEMQGNTHDCAGSNRSQYGQFTSDLLKVDEALYECERGNCGQADVLMYDLAKSYDTNPRCGGGCSGSTCGNSQTGKEFFRTIGLSLKNQGMAILENLFAGFEASLVNSARSITSSLGGPSSGYTGCGRGSQRDCVSKDELYEYGLALNRNRYCGCEN